MKLELYGKAIDPKRFVPLVAVPLACCVVAAAVFFPQYFSLALMLLVCLPFILLSIDRPAIIFYVLILVLYSNLDVYAPFRVYRYIVLFLLASLAIAFANGRRFVTHHPHVIALAAAFTIIAFQSLAVARDYGVAARNLRVFFKVLVSLAIVMQFTRDRKEFRRFLLAVAGGMLLSDLLPFFVRPPERFGSLSVLWGQGIVRYEGFVFEPNTFALFQLFLIPVLIFLAAAYRKRRAVRAFFMLSVLASVAVLILSFSRGGFIGLAFLIVTLIVIERRNKPLALFGVSLVAASIVFIPGVYWERIGSVFDFATKRAGDFAIYTRVETMKVALRLGIDHPLLGVGLGNFIPSSAYFIPHGVTVHNSFLQVLSELGLVAFSLFVGIVACNFRIIRRMMRNDGDPEIAQVGRSLCMQHIAMLVSSLFVPVFYDLIMWLMLAMPAIAEHAYGDGAAADGSGAPVSSGRK
jgi:O-antigen ligase